MATAVVDVTYLSSYLSVPKSTLVTLVDEPTKELVNAVLQAVSARAREHDEVNDSKLRLGVELENAVRTGDSRTRGLKASVEKGLNELAELRGKLKEEENARSALETELQNAKSSSSISASEVQTLRSRVSTLESSNRDTVSLLESKCTSYDRLSQELSTQQQKSIDFRREITELEQSVQTAQSAATRAKFKEENYQSEIERLTNSNDFLSTELKTKTAEYLKYRKEKSARIAELERVKEEAESSSQSHQRMEESLRARLQELTQKYDDSIAKIQGYEDQAVNAEQSFRTELASISRLADLWEESAKSAKERIKELETALEELREGESELIGRLRAEADTERTEKESAEQRISELEDQVERLEADILALQHAPSLPGTPRRGINGASTPQLHRESSEVFSPSSSTRTKGNLNFTQLYAEYSTAKAELVAERRRNEKLSATMDDMVQDLESKGPEIQEMKAENERLQSEVMEISSMLEDSHKNRDRAKKEARKWEGEVEGFKKEGDLLRQQLRDLSIQVKILLSEIHIRDEGLDELSIEQRSQLENIARGSIDEDDETTDTDRFISQHLTTFKSIRELQEQNANLLKITRELGQKMENEEALMKKSQLAEEKEELERLRTRVEKYKDEIKTMMTTSQSYIKERDMFRRMLQHRGQLPSDADLGSLFGQSVPPATPSRGGLVPTVEHSPNTKEAAENASLLRELQAHFDSFREEAATDRRTLKDQTERLSRERGELQAQLARVNSQLTLATERFEMLQANYDMLKNENAELQKRSQILSESAAKQDVRTQQVAEDLVEAKSMIESMRTEAANLKAEKTLFKSIEQRMSQDNESLRNERARLNTLIANLENLQNQRELSETEMRNRLESQRQTLESELQTTRRKLEAEVEEGKKAALRKEYDSQQNQKRIDDLVATLGTIREELVATKTMKDHLQARVDELAIELKSAEEKVQALHPRPTLRSNANVNTEAGENDVDEDALSREQELTIEISELKRDLELATAQVEALKVDVGNYKDISQAAEDGLQSINETHDQYREETDRVIEEKDSKIRDLEQRVEEITSELTNTNAELSAVRAEAAEKARRTEEDKSSLGAEIARLKDEGERYIMTAQFHQEDLRTQATIAQEAQVNYERELVKHADAAKALQKIRGDYNELKTRDMGLQIEAEAAKAALAQSQDNWDDMQKNFEKELSEMRARRDDLISQNKLLHQQLEAFGSQVAALQQNRASHVDAEGEGTPGGTPSGTDNSVDDFREIIRYLRREKEIVDVQYELSIQESKRLKKQLDHTQSQLDETRLKLEQERRSQADIGRSSAAHKDLMEKLNELNLIRESSVTLRNEARVTRGQLEEKSRKVEELLTQIQPLESRVRELENQLEIKNGEMKLLQEDRDRWQQRNQQILQKYDRIDPAEMESLKERIAALQKERDELSTEKQGFAALKEQVDTIHEQIRIAQEEAIAPWRQRQEKLIEQTKERLRNIRSQLTEKVTEYEAVVKEKENLELQLSATRQELEAVKSRRDEAHADAISSQPLRQAPAPEAVTHNGFEEGQVAEDHQQYAKLSEQERKIFEEKIALAEAEAREKEEKVRRLQDVSVTHEQKIEGLNREVVSLDRLNYPLLMLIYLFLQQTEVRGRLEIANSQLAQLEKSRQNVEATSQMDTESTEAVEKLRRDLSAAQREVEALKTEAAIQQTIGNVSMDENSKPLAEQISDRVDAIKSDLETKHNERIQDLEGTYIRRTEHMKNQLNKKLHESRAQNSLEIEKLRAEHQQETNDLNAQHQKEVERLNNRLQEEIERVKKEESRFEEQKRAISTQQPQTVASTEAGHPANIKSEALDVQIQPQDWSPTQVKDFIASNATAKDILQRNVQSKLARERETLVARIKEEESKLTEAKLEEAQRSVEAIKERLEEAQKNIEAVKEKAVAMESQKSKVKISMAENRAKQAQAKIEVVEKAATEEPQKPVVEVWAIAKLAKPPSLLPPQGDAQTGSFGRPQQPQGQQAPQTSVFGKPTLPLTQTPDPAAEGSEQAQQQKQPTSMQFPQNPPSSSLPSKPPPSQQNAGTGPGALRSILGAGQSAIPRGGGGVGRGQQGRRGSSQQNQGQNQNQNQSQPPQSFQQPQQLFQAQQFHPGQNLNQRGGNQTNLPRGGGNRGGRGGRGGSSQNVNTGTGGMRNNSPGNSPGSARGGLNAGARQFVPQGNKRPRDDGPDNSNDGGNIGKRVRGAAGGGA
ncbi:hypothetical protein FGG08_001330 [Glutinoglossum americanum]|uniref:Nucleoprotein TPR/MLP1 domain-containing protein n=1 Tax=Glutinoglossum americanum TaxID=1670608 RepID=A0A9P8L0D5_9PEZI|nr:hypothetical protein FGG08_001330 [Glutinoglossum americanum]